MQARGTTGLKHREQKQSREKLSCGNENEWEQGVLVVIGSQCRRGLSRKTGKDQSPGMLGYGWVKFIYLIFI